MSAFMGTGIACLMLTGGSFFWWNSPDGKLLLASSLIFIIACVGITLAFNVPLNDALASTDPGTQQAADMWARFLRDWTLGWPAWKMRFSARCSPQIEYGGSPWAQTETNLNYLPALSYATWRRRSKKAQLI
jgi:hypothetical protein